jgi:hypothetical protein
MAQQYSCIFSIPEGSLTTGGQLTGGFAGGGPDLQNGDSIVVSVVYPAATGAPSTLTGTTVFTESPLAPTTQTSATPFVRGGANGNFLCLATQQAQGTVSGNTTVYAFPPMLYGGGVPGSYELTFIASNNTVSPPVQWSEDPEFDTSS